MRGYAVLYGVESRFFWRFGTKEMIAPGAFDFSVRAGIDIDGTDIFACLNHKPERRIGKRLRLWSDEVGVGFEIPGVRIPRDCTGCSFEFTPVRWHRRSDLLHILTHAHLSHITLLTAPESPAYPATLAYLEEDRHERQVPRNHPST